MTRTGTVALGYLDNGTWAAEFGLCRTNLLIRDLTGDQKIMCHKELRCKAHAAGIADGRNRMVRGFLEDTDAEWLFMVDTDMTFAADVVDRLLESVEKLRVSGELVPVLGGLCFGYAPRRDDAGRVDPVPTIYEYARILEDGKEKHVGFANNLGYSRDEVNQVAATGAACLLLHRDTMLFLEEKIGENWFSHLTHPTGDNGRARIYSEDFSFFARCMQYGVPAYVDASIKTGHIKGSVTLDEAYFDDYSLKERSGNPE